MKKTTQTYILGIVTLILIVLAAYTLLPKQSENHTDQQGQSKDLETVSLAMNPVPHSVHIYIALEKGYFAEQGLDIKVHKFASGKQALDTLLAGGADIATTADFPLTLAGLSGQEVYVTAMMGHFNDMKVIARNDFIDSLQDLRGKRIATKKGGGGEFFMYKLLDKESISLDSVDIYYVDPPDMPAALVRGDIDAFIIWEPYVSKAKKDLGDAVIVFSPKDIYGETWNLAVNKDFDAENPEAVKKFLKAIIKADNFFQNNRQESIEITMKHTGAEKDIINYVLDSAQSGFGLSSVLPDQMEEAAEWLIEKDVVNNDEIPDYDAMIKPDYLNELKPDSVALT
ncbi:ABC transporter substrate-binding protein [Thermoproteota archaeon]